MPYVLRSLLGKGATTGLLVLIFMAITSTVSSSMIAVSSIISLDGYRTYINPRASDRKTLKVSHIGVVFHGAFMAAFAIMLEYAGATNNWSFYFRPIVSCTGIFPMMLALLWDRQTKLATIASTILGICSGLATWLSLSWYWGGAINIETTQIQLAGLYGGTVSFFSPLIYSVIISLAWPKKFDWRVFLQIDLIEDKTSTLPSGGIGSLVTEGETKTPADVVDEEKKLEHPSSSASPAATSTVSPARSEQDLSLVTHPFDPETIKHIKRWFKIAVIYLIVNMLVTIVLWPLPLYRDYVFSKSFFGGWVTMALIWQWFALCSVVIFPIYDGRHAIAKTVRGLLRDSRLRRERRRSVTSSQS